MAKKRKLKQGRKKRKSRVSDSPLPFYRRWPFLLGAVLLITIVALSPLLTADFVDIDDSKLILEKQRDFEHAPGKIFRYAKNTPHYKPVTYLSWLIEYYLTGNASWFNHLNNLLLHLLNCVFVFLITRMVAVKFEVANAMVLPLALVSALLFGIHPMHVESVGWAVERKDVLYSLFFLFSMWSYLKFLNASDRKWLWISVAGFLLSVFSKSPAIVLPFVLLLLDWAWKRPLRMRTFLEKWPYFIVMLIALFAFGFFSLDTTEGSLGAIAEQEIMSKAPNAKHLPTLYAKALIGSMQGLLWYVHSWLPAKLSLAYPREEIIARFGVSLHLFPWLLLLAAGLLWWKRRSWPFVFFCHAFFFLTLLPAMIRVTPGVGIFLNDRYVYLPLFGIALLAGSLIWRLKNKTLRYSVLGLVALILVIQSFTLSKTWQNTEALWSNVIRKYPGVAYAYTNRGSFYRQEGDLQRAIQDLNRAVELDADANNLNQRGVVLRQMGRQQEAIQDYNRAIEDDPDNHQAWLNRGNAWLDLGRLDEALQDFNSAIDRNSRLPKAYVNRGVVYAQKRQVERAFADFEQAAALDPAYPDTYLNRGVLYAQLSRKQEAIAEFQRYLELRPDDHQIWFDLGNLHQSMGEHAQAVQYYTRAIALSPSPAYFKARAVSHQALGNTQAANNDRAAAGGR